MHITTPITLFCGSRDNLSDVSFMRANLPNVDLNIVEGYEHLDLIWAMTAAEEVWLPMCKIIEGDRLSFNLENLQLDTSIALAVL